MTLSEFYQKFSDEEECKLKFKQIRDQAGVVCKKCGCTEHYWQQTIWQYECKECKFRTTLKSGTVLEGSKLPYRYWLTGMAYLTTTKKSISALQLQKELGHKRYEPIWAMLHKLRLAMRYRDTKYELKECVEMDEGFFEKSDRSADYGDEQDETKGKRGRGSQKQAKVLVAAESKAVEKEQQRKHRPKKSVGFIKMSVMDSLDSKSINYEAQNMLCDSAKVKTDGYRGYSRLKEVVSDHSVEVVYDKTKVSKTFPWVHIAISNAKRLLLGIHHSINSKYLQNYLDEFCYKFNRRYIDNLFERMLIASASTTWYQNMYKSG